MAQHNNVAVDQEYDRCPRMRSRTPVIFDLRGQGEKVIIIKNGFSQAESEEALPIANLSVSHNGTSMTKAELL